MVKASCAFDVCFFWVEVERARLLPKGLFQVLWVVYTTQNFKEKMYKKIFRVDKRSRLP